MSVPIVVLPLVDGDAPMLLVPGAALSVVLGDVVVLGEVVLGEVVLGAALSLGDVAVLFDGADMLGDVGACAPADELGLELLLLLESVPLVCAYTRPAATASATPVLAAMVLNLVMTAPVSKWMEPSRCPPALGIQRAAIAMPIACAIEDARNGFNVCAWVLRLRARRWQTPSIGCTASSS
ncbi:MAG TPA: hypothetical protein VEX14_15595 [Burkholderiaceae bacterium]|nr:hypothetical protein [Burkholderiaceae bacterium]